MTTIKRADSDRPLSPDLPGLTRWLNELLRPIVRELRNQMNANLLTAVTLPQYAQGLEPTLSEPAIIYNSTTNRPRFRNAAGVWTDL